MVDFASQRTPTTLSYEQYIHLPGIDSDPHQTFEKQFLEGYISFSKQEKLRINFIVYPTRSCFLYLWSQQWHWREVYAVDK